jgi:hypothetical protein
MADNVTAGTQAAGFDRAGGFGATEQRDDNSDQIRDLLDQVQQLMIEDGADPATAEALTNYARPAQQSIAGNLADLNRMGQIAVTGKVDTPPGQKDIPATDLSEAFAEPPAPDLNTGLQTPMGQVDADGNPVDGGGGNGDSRTKAEIQAELDDRGIAYTSSDTKAELLAKLNA